MIGRDYLTTALQYLFVLFLRTFSFIDIFRSLINQIRVTFISRIRFSHVKFTTNSAAVNQVVLKMYEKRTPSDLNSWKWLNSVIFVDQISWNALGHYDRRVYSYTCISTSFYNKCNVLFYCFATQSQTWT